MGHPEELLDDPSHRRSDDTIQQADNGQRSERTDVLWIERRNNAGEQEAWHGDVLVKFRQRRNIYIYPPQKDYR